MNVDDLTAMPGQPLPRQYVRKYGLAFLVIALLFLALIAAQMVVSRVTAQESARTNAKNLGSMPFRVELDITGIGGLTG